MNQIFPKIHTRVINFKYEKKTNQSSISPRILTHQNYLLGKKAIDYMKCYCSFVNSMNISISKNSVFQFFIHVNRESIETHKSCTIESFRNLLSNC